MLESKGLTKKYGSKTAVDQVTLTLEPGHVYGLLGPNGSGKTTWMKMVGGLVKPTAGSVLFNGEKIGVASRRHIAYMATEPYFYPWMTAESAGKYYRDFFKDFSMEKYLAQLETMKLDKKQKITAMSTGMAAKMKIAITIARDADIWLLDEPFNGIDLLARDAIRDTILSAMNEKKILVLSSHLVEEMNVIADRAVFIREGQLIENREVKEMTEKGVSMADRYREIFGHMEG